MLIAVLALVAAGVGLFWQDGSSPFSFTPLRGETVQMYGRGLYRYDTLFSGAGYKGLDTVTLVLGIPLLMLAVLLYRRGSLRGGLLLLGALSYFLYIYASLALGAAYNNLFLLYIALFSASLFAFVLAFTAIDRPTVAARLATRTPHRTFAIYLFASGLLTLVVWLAPLLGSLIERQPPKLLDSYTTVVTDVLDLGIIVPALFFSGGLLLRRNPLGYLIAVPLLLVIVLLLPVITLGTLNQLAAGIVFTTGEIVGPIAGFLVLGLVAIWLLGILLRNLGDATVDPSSLLQAAHA
jgi:hypothetical protein